MIRSHAPLRVECSRALRAYLATPGEETLHAAYTLGRSALASGVGLLDLVLLVMETARELPQEGTGAGAAPQRVSPTFLVECLSPYEMAFRGAREVNSTLLRQNEVMEEEVRRIAHALHDTAGQSLAWAHFEVERAKRTAPAASVPSLEKVRHHLDRLEADLRAISHELRPTVLDDLGLLPALEFLADSVSRRAGLAVSVSGGAVGRLPRAAEVAIYRAVQEALTNVERHAHATRVTIRVELAEGEVRCLVEDDGVGFEACTAAPRHGDGGLGLVGIRERLAALGGSLACSTSERGRGARLVMTLPRSRTDAAATAAR